MRPAEIITLFSQRYPQAEFPASFWSFLQEQERLDYSVRRARTGEPLRAFLQRLGVAREILDGLLDEDSKIILKTSFPGLLGSSPAKVHAYFAEHFRLVFQLQETVLDSETLTGFNRHGGEHLRSVTHRMQMLLGACSQQVRDSRTRTLAIIAGYVHDIGNLVSRKDHGIYGLYLLPQLFTEYDRDEPTLAAFLQIMEAVLFHEVEYGSRFASLCDLSPVTLSLIIADKTDVNLRRVSDKSNASEAVQDAHTLVNLLTGDSRVKCQRTSLQWEIHFSPIMPGAEAVRLPALLKRAERVWVPDEWQKLYRQENIEYVFIFHATFLRLYLSRLAFAIRAVFALYPSIETFRLVIDDDERGVSLSRSFSRDDYAQKLGMIYNNLFKNQNSGADDS